ncbi:MAG: PQQ-dependent sugar dehydrogenase [Gaiellaceae bacterium]
MATLIAGLLLAAVFTGSASGQVLRGGSSARTEAVRIVEIASGYDSPVHVTAPRNERNRLYVVEQRGVIRVIENGRKRAAPFLDIHTIVGCCGERGLLSVAFHPQYKKNRKFYVNYTDRNGDTQIVEYRSNGRKAIKRSRRVLMTLRQPFGNHNGGQIAFAPNGRLYVGTGDGGDGGDPGNVSQKLNSKLGKMLAINVNKKGSAPVIKALGLRNPWRFSFDRKTGALYIGDVGQNAFEEIDFVPKSKKGLLNFGWDAFEGNADFEPGNLNSAGSLIAPIATYGRGDGCSVTGGHVYRGKKVPAMTGRYFYGDFCQGTIWSLKVVNGKARGKRKHAFNVSSLSSFGENARGELFMTSLGGSIYRLAA